MAKYKIYEIELSPRLLHKLFEHVRKPETTEEHIGYIIENLKDLSKTDELLTLDQFELIIQKPALT
jgi:hypothetical protein